jgi:hypothetical protein
VIVGAINDAWDDNYERQKQYLYEQYERQTGGLASALGMQQAIAQQYAKVAPKKSNPEPNPVLLLTGDEE